MQRLVHALLALTILVGSAQAAANTLLSAPSADETRTKALGWVAAQGITDKATLERIGKAWALDGKTVSPSQMLNKVVGTFASIDAKSKTFVEGCNLLSTGPPQKPELLKGKKDTFYTANMRLFFGRFLAQKKMYDEALEVLGSLDPKTVVDPAGCLYFKAVCEHQLLKRTEGLATIQQLLENTAQVPLRYKTTAELMQHDLQALKKDSLTEISRKMKDVERRLDLGRGGQRIQKEEDEIVASLDAIIEKLEQQGGG